VRGSENRKGFGPKADAKARRSRTRMPARAPVTKLWQGQSQDRAARD